MMTTTLHIGGMSCSHCAARVERALRSVPGVTASVDLAANTATVSSDADVDGTALVNAVLGAGYIVEA